MIVGELAMLAVLAVGALQLCGGAQLRQCSRQGKKVLAWP